MIYDRSKVERFLNFFNKLLEPKNILQCFCKECSDTCSYDEISTLSSRRINNIIFHLRPSLPKLSFIWDMQIILCLDISEVNMFECFRGQ